jgi:diguanylate cyclase (GGDEF)-like protein
MSELQNAALGYSVANEKDTLYALLNNGLLRVLRLPAPLEQAFRQHYRKHSATLMRNAIVGLVALYFLVVWPISLFSSAPLMPIWQAYAVVPIGVVLVVIWTATRMPFMQQHVEVMLAGSLFVCLCGTIYCSMLLNNQYLGQVAAYETIYVMMVGSAILRMPSRVAIIAMLAALAVTIPVLSSNTEGSGFWPNVFLYVGVPLLICAVGGYFMEYAERRSFLQERLLEIQDHQLDGLNKLARIDALSGLANRRHLDESLRREWERARREQHSLAIVFLDIDYFKRYNDHYGHTAGDRCLALIGSILGMALHRPADLAARYGGEEFMLVLPNTDVEGARLVAERISATLDDMALPHPGSPASAHVTISIGIAACIPERDSDPRMLVDAADIALYESKAAGRHRITTAGDQPDQGSVTSAECATA